MQSKNKNNMPNDNWAASARRDKKGEKKQEGC